MGIKLKIITPNGNFIDGKDVDIINVKTIDGDMGILKNMAPFVTGLKIGTLNFRSKGEITHIHVHGGLMVITQQECKIITERLYLVDEHKNKIPTPEKLV